MPNNIENHLQASAEVIASLKGEKTIIDFNSIVPMPESLDISASSGIEEIVEIVFGLKPKSGFEPLNNLQMNSRLKRVHECSPFHGIDNDKDWNDLIAALNNQRQYGHYSWYPWAIANWGTKWNAYDINEGRCNAENVYFQTAWSPPRAVFEALVKKFPNEEFTLRYADEDAGCNSGILTAKGGVVSEHKNESNSREAWLQYIDLHRHGETLDEEFFSDYEVPADVRAEIEKIRSAA